MEEGVLRVARLPPDPWLPRLRERFAPDFHTPLQVDAQNYLRHAGGSWGFFDVAYMQEEQTPPAGFWSAIFRFLTAPYIRLNLAGLAERQAAAVRALESEKECDFDAGEYADEVKESLPRWNILGRISIPPLLRAWTSLRVADLDAEFTERILRARLARSQTGRWPTEPSPSEVCEGVSWVHEVGGDGSLALRTSDEPFLEEATKLPWRKTLRP
jgi:hypothetical protein